MMEARPRDAGRFVATYLRMSTRSGGGLMTCLSSWIRCWGES